MLIYHMEITLYLPEVHNLKEKRRILKSLKDRVWQNFRVAIAETDAQDKWQRGVIEIVGFAGGCGEADRIMEKLLRVIEDHLDGDVLSCSKGYL